MSSIRCSWPSALATSASAARTVLAALRLDTVWFLTFYLSTELLNDYITWSIWVRGKPMPNAAITAEPIIRLSFFLGVLLLMVLWELLTPRRQQAVGRGLRWPNNLGLVVLDTLVVRLLFPFAGVGMAFLAQRNGWGLFNLFPLPAWITIPVAVLL